MTTTARAGTPSPSTVAMNKLLRPQHTHSLRTAKLALATERRRLAEDHAAGPPPA